MRTHVYHVGDLNAARMLDPELDAYAASLWDDAQAGRAFLTQRRRADGRIEYLVTRAA